MNLKSYLFVSSVNQENERGRWVESFLALPQGFLSFPTLFLGVKWRNLVHVECLKMIKPIVVGFCSNVILADGCGIWEHLHIFRETKCLRGYLKTLMNGYIKFRTPPVISWTVGFQSGVLPISRFLISGYKCRFPIRGGPSLNRMGS